jgi:hypothetical protein
VPPTNPLITLALQTAVPSGNHVWNLHTADGDLVGWTPTLPSDIVLRPDCWQYGTGNPVNVDFAPDTHIIELPQP